jgi:sugar phosphate isomerase/epimerase
VETLPDDARHGATGRPRLSMDMITFFNAKLWGYEHFTELWRPGAVPPEVFWDRALEVIAKSGIVGVEITGGMASYKSALARYGSAEGFANALKGFGLELSSGFHTGMLYDSEGKWDSTGMNWANPARQADLLHEVEEYASFLRAAGSEVLVMGLPMRKSWNAAEPRFVDLDYAQRLADLLNRVGYTARMNGVRFAIHTEARSAFWLRRDIDLFLLLTDPVYVDFCPDTAHITLGGSDPADILADHASRVALTHWKDARGTVTPHVVIDDNIEAALHPMFARVGTGVMDWHRWARKLREVNYDGWAIIELDAAEDPGYELATARAYVTQILNHTYGTTGA